MRSFRQRTLALLQHVLFRDDIMLLEDITSLFNEGHVRQKTRLSTEMVRLRKTATFYVQVLENAVF